MIEPKLVCDDSDERRIYVARFTALVSGVEIAGYVGSMEPKKKMLEPSTCIGDRLTLVYWLKRYFDDQIINDLIDDADDMEADDETNPILKGFEQGRTDDTVFLEKL
jgi:hypothetical protein